VFAQRQLRHFGTLVPALINPLVTRVPLQHVCGYDWEVLFDKRLGEKLEQQGESHFFKWAMTVDILLMDDARAKNGSA